MSDRAQQTILQELERLLPHIRRLEVENKATADEKAATTEAAIGEQLAKVIARDAALQRETEQQRAARERVAAVEAAPIVEAIRAAPQASPQAAEQEPSVLDRLGALPDLKKGHPRRGRLPRPRRGANQHGAGARVEDQGPEVRPRRRREAPRGEAHRLVHRR